MPFKRPFSLCLIGGFALFPGALLAEFINKEIKRKKLNLLQTMPLLGILGSTESIIAQYWIQYIY